MIGGEVRTIDKSALVTLCIAHYMSTYHRNNRVFTIHQRGLWLMIDKKICAIYQKNINCSLQTHTHQDDSLTVTKISLTLPWRSSRTDFPGEHRALFSAAAEHNSHKSQVPDILPVGGIIQHRSTHLFIYIKHHWCSLPLHLQCDSLLLCVTEGDVWCDALPGHRQWLTPAHTSSRSASIFYDSTHCQ